MDLPEPDGPTSASVSPGRTASDAPSRTGSLGAYPNRTSRSSIPTGPAGTSRASGASVISGWASTSS